MKKGTLKALQTINNDRVEPKIGIQVICICC